MSSNTRLTRCEYICLHVSIMMYAAVLVSNLSSVNSSTTTTTTTTAPSSTLTTKNVTGATSTESGTTTETTTLQGISTEETTTQPDDTSQSTTDSNKITTNDYTTQSPETTTDMSTQSTINAVTSETTSTSATTQNNTLITISTTTSTEEPETTTTSDTITQETSSISVENSISTEASITMTTTTQDPNVTSRSASDTTISASSESTEAPKDNQTTTTQRSSDTTSSVSNTTTPNSVESTETSITYSTEGTNLTTTTQEPDSTTTVPDTTTESPSTYSTEATNQTTTSPSVENTTITQPSTAAIPTTQPTTTATRATTARTTTKSYQITPVYPSIENAVLEFSFELKFTDCTYNKTLIESKLSVVSGSVEGCKYIRVKSINSGPCPTGRKKRSASTPQVSVDTVFGVDAQMGISSGSNVSNNLYTTLYSVENIDVGYLNETKDNFTAALTSKQICDSDVCTSALVGRPGFVCVAEPSENNTQRCALMYYCDHQPIDCGKYGHCYVETEIQSERVFYTSKCRCTNEEFFRYEGSRCTERVITWELAVIICASASGALVLLLLFIVIVICCRNASNSADVSFEESELMYTPSGIASANGRNGRDASKGVENQGYMEVRDTSGSWKPEASANTYAHIESKLREHNYEIQIKRPQVTQFRKSDEITEF